MNHRALIRQVYVYVFDFLESVYLQQTAQCIQYLLQDDELEIVFGHYKLTSSIHYVLAEGQNSQGCRALHPHTHPILTEKPW